MAALPSAAGIPPMSLELGNSFGVMLLSTIIVSALYGATTMQTWYYYEHFPKDSWMLKATVAIVWMLDTLTIVLDSHAIYHYLIDNFDNLSALGIQVWSAQVEVLVTYAAVVIVQLFFVWRIYQLRPHVWYIPLILGVTAVASFGVVIVIVVRLFKNPFWSDTNSPAVNNPLIANWVLGMFVDFSITIVLCWYLWRDKATVRDRTNRVLNRIIVFSVHRGAIAAVIQVLSFLTKLTFPNNLVWIAFHNGLCKVYANSMLATLNSRVALRDMMGNVDVDEPSRGTLSVAQRSARGTMASVQFARNQTSTFETRTLAWNGSDEEKGSVPGAMQKARMFRLEVGQPASTFGV